MNNTIFLPLAAIALSITCQCANASDWVKDRETDCALWWGAQQSINKMSVAWSGGCKDGKADGRGTANWFFNGERFSRYDGDYKNGKMHGKGKLTAGVFEYDGEFKDDLQDGYGVLTINDRTKARFEGENKSGKPWNGKLTTMGVCAKYVNGEKVSPTLLNPNVCESR